MTKNKKWNWWKIVGYSLAGVVLCGALVYYNLPDEGETLGKINEACPDFQLDCVYTSKEGKLVIDEEATFTMSEQKGKVVVLNFWATYCQPCKKEIPHFNELYEKYKDEGLEVVILNGEFDKSAQGLLDGYLNNEGIKDYTTYYHEWNKYTCTFGRYEKGNDILAKFDVGVALPVTIVVDREGIIQYMKEESLTYEELEGIVSPLLEAEIPQE